MNQLTANDFLSLIWPRSLLRNETLELRVIRRSDKALIRRFYKSQGDLLTAAKQFGVGWDIYYGVSTRTEKGGKKEDCLRIGCVWVDFDNIVALPAFSSKLQPDIIVSSGGGYHCYWLLQTPVICSGRWNEIEAINRGLAKKLNEKVQKADKTKDNYGADLMTVDVTRILRVPDFFNYKYNPPKKVIANAL